MAFMVPATHRANSTKLFSDNLVNVVDNLTLQDKHNKHNICT